MILKPYPPDIRPEIYLLALSCELIKNRPISSTLAQRWKGDYLSNSSENSKAAIYINAVNELKKSESFGRILFSSFVLKVLKPLP